MSNIASVLTETATRCPQRPALRIAGTILSLMELDELSARVSGGLLAHGVRPGDRVKITAPGPAFPVLYFGALRAGAVVVVNVPKPFALGQRGAARGTRLVFTSPEDQHALGAEAGDTTVVRVGPDFLDQVAFWPQHPGVARRNDDDVAVVVDTTHHGQEARCEMFTHAAVRQEAATIAEVLSLATAVGDTSQLVPGPCPSHPLQGSDTGDLAGACRFMPHAHTPPTASAQDDKATARPLTPATVSNC